MSDSFLAPDDTNVPVGVIETVEGTPADLRSGKLLKEAFIHLPTGFEHYYLFEEGLSDLRKVAEFVDTNSDRRLEVHTTEPGMLFYTGYFTSNELKRTNGDQYGKFRAFCCETHRYPNGPNLEYAPGAITQPGETYKSRTRFKIIWP